MSDLHNEKMVEELFDWVSERMGRQASETDVKKNKLGFYIENPKREYLPDNLQEICLMLNK